MSRYSDDTLVLTLVRQARTLLDRLGLPESFALAELHRRVELHRGRRIHLIPYALPPHGPHGMWVTGANADYVFFDEAAPSLRRLQIIGHEFGHILFDDEGGPVHPEQLAALLPPDDLPEGTVNANTRTLTACTRTAYDDLIEQRCEWFGTVVVQRIDRSAPLGIARDYPPSRASSSSTMDGSSFLNTGLGGASARPTSIGVDSQRAPTE
jgi:hypothetical protein